MSLLCISHPLELSYRETPKSGQKMKLQPEVKKGKAC